jgi:type III secretion system chaperone SycN
MDWIQQAVANFLTSIGLPGMALNHDGAVLLRTGSGGAIEFQYVSEGSATSLMLAWSEPDRYDLPRHLKSALRMADFRNAGSMPLMVAAHTDQLVLATRLQERSVSQSALEESMDWLRQMHEQIRNS